jgi:hypothetical protein
MIKFKQTNSYRRIKRRGGSDGVEKNEKEPERTGPIQVNQTGSRKLIKEVFGPVPFIPSSPLSLYTDIALTSH